MSFRRFVRRLDKATESGTSKTVGSSAKYRYNKSMKSILVSLSLLWFFCVPVHGQDLALSSSSCSSQLKNVLEDLGKKPWDSFTNEELKAAAPTLMRQFWQLRLSIHKNLHLLSPECNLLAREIFHQLRDGDDYLSEFAYDLPVLDPEDLDFQSQPIPIKNPQAYPPFYLASGNPQNEFEFKSGDLFIARGISFFSAIISQVSNNKAHFSHNFVVHVDDHTQEIRTIESYVGVGVQSYDLDFALKNENVRLMILRPKDPVLGAKAGAAALHAANLRLPYDYKMDFEDDQQMSCVEVPTYSYKKASDGTVKLPMYPAQLQLNNPDFLSALGLKKGPLITPDDLETDPRFDLVLDWKDARLIRDSRQKDAILSEIIRWLGDLQYQFHDTPKSLFTKYILLPLRQTFLWPLIEKFPGVPKIDKHIPAKTLATMTVLDQVGHILLKELKEQDEAHKKRLGRPMTNPQLRAWLEKIRSEDLEKYNLGKSSLFHKMLRPN